MTAKKSNLTRRPNIAPAAPQKQVDDAAFDAWVNSAPDGKKAAPAPTAPHGFVTVPRELLMKKGRQISLRLPDELVERLDAVAAAHGMTRSDWLLRAISAQVQADGG